MQIARTFKPPFLNFAAVYHYQRLDLEITTVNAGIVLLLSMGLQTHLVLEMGLAEYISEDTDI